MENESAPGDSVMNNKNSPGTISIKEFLNFLKTAYQVNDNSEGALIPGGLGEAVNWLKQKETQYLLQKNSISSQTSDTLLQDDKKDLVQKKSTSSVTDVEPLKKKLSEVLTEGLLDSVLPYMIQNAGCNSKKNNALVKISEKQLLKTISNSSSENKINVKRRSSDATAKVTVNKTSNEVEIHVCDELKSTRKTFVCNQKLLVEKMGYFAEVTQGQRLEDMDISVHCDITIFEWLMQWVKKESLLEEDWPQLDPQCVIPILVSAAFLQMEPLLNDCLLFCHEHMNEILRTTTNLSCLNDSVLTRLAAMYTNTEVEAIRDRKDKIQSRLFSKLIQSLGETEPESVRGHWCSLSRIFKCDKCHQLISPDVAFKIPCVPSCMRLQPDGSILSLHTKDSGWDINDYIMKLNKTLKTWRKVYWRIWGDAHFLFCTTCKRYFPSNQIGWCRFHPDTPQFFTLDAQKAPLPIGRYPCCGERAYRFQLLEDFNGCQFRQHTVCTQDVKDSAIFTMLEAYRHLIEEEPPQLLFPERLTRLVARDLSNADKKFVCKETFWWDGFEIIPPRPKLGLLSKFTSRADGISSEESSEEFEDEDTSTSSESDSEEDGSAESNPSPKRVVKKRKAKKKKVSKLWQSNLSARSNQDMQRAYEEKVLKEMTCLLNKNVINENVVRLKTASKNVTPLGGLWVRLEAEWKEGAFQSNPQNRTRLLYSNPRIARNRSTK